MFKHAVDEPVLARIGDVMVSFSMLERMLDLYIAGLLAVPQRIGRCICAALTFTQARQMTIAVYNEKFGHDEDYAILADVLKRAGQAEEHRNAIAHSEWGRVNDLEVSRLKDSTRGFKGLKITTTDHTAEDIGAIATELAKVTGDLGKLWERQHKAKKLVDCDGAFPWSRPADS